MTPQERIADLEKQVLEISQILKGHLSNWARACHVQDRREIREEIAKLKAEIGVSA